MTTGSIERELRRAAWRRYRRVLCLADASDERFGQGGLAARMREVSLRVLLLPADPEQQSVSFDDAFWSRFMLGQEDPISGDNADWGNDGRPTWSAACRFDDWDGGWRRALAVYRSGAVEALVGRGVAWERGDDKIFTLTGVVGHIWNTLSAWRSFTEWLDAEFPWELSVALVGTANAFLSGFAKGWRDYDDLMSPISRCPEAGLLLRRELGSPVDAAGVRELALTLGGQVEDAWGSRRRRFFVWNGEPTLEFDSSRWHW